METIFREYSFSHIYNVIEIEPVFPLSCLLTIYLMTLRMLRGFDFMLTKKIVTSQVNADTKRETSRTLAPAVFTVRKICLCVTVRIS